MKARKKILDLLDKHKELSVKDISEHLMVSTQYIHRILKDLKEDGEILKIGKPPKTYYKINPSKETKSSNNQLLTISYEKDLFLKENFFVISDIGEILEGIAAFTYWCTKRNLPTNKTLEEFISTKEKYSKYYNSDKIVDGINKLRNTKGFENIYLDALLYFDFYAIERFGKTKIGSIMHYAKQAQNKMLMQILIDNVKTRFHRFISTHNFDAVGFVPPTIKREAQIMKFIEKKLEIPLPQIEIQKISNIIPIPQKSLSKLEERITNADNTFVVNSKQKFKNILLIDDAVGSGATLNQIARKIKEKNIAKKITAIAIVGSFKGFDVITDI
jgi:DNA-binding Lrp family transcriptional regulator